MSDQEKKKTTIKETDLYFMFISIVFGVFIAVWIEPVTKLFPYEALSYGANPSIEAFEKIFVQLMSTEIRNGFIMFVMLVCLWWWYSVFLGNLSPGKGFWLYFYDFITLCSFALAFRLWHHPIIFPPIVVVAAGLMLGRFGGLLFHVTEVRSNTRARHALWVALLVLGSFVLFGGGIIAAPAFGDGPFKISLMENWSTYQGVVVWLLLVGIGATFLAVFITEGRPLKPPRGPLEWKAEKKIG